MVKGPVPGPPIEVTAEAVSSTALRVRWQAPPSGPMPEHYWVRVEGPGGGVASELSRTLEATVGFLTPEEAYRVRVEACGPYACSARVPADGIVVSLPAHVGVLRGTVTGPDGTPLAGARVAAFRDGDTWVPSAVGTTGPDGAYVIEALVPDRYQVLAVPPEASGLRGHWSPGTVSRAGARWVFVDGGVDTDAIDVAVPQPEAISGVVSGPGGPVPGATVWAYRSGDTWLGSVSTTTGADGTYTLSGLDPGRYAVRAVPPAGSGLAGRWHPGTLSRPAASEVWLDGGGATGIDIRWPAPTSIAGRVTGPDGQPLAGAKVAVFGVHDSWFFSTASVIAGEDGRYEVTGLDPGPYQVRVAPRPGSGAAACWYQGTVSRSHATPVPVLEGDAATGVDVACPVG
jgi:protocatechuate 3,4-dioxygenase beta subunit